MITAAHLAVLMFILPMAFPRVFGIPPGAEKLWRRVFFVLFLVAEGIINAFLLPLYLWPEAPPGNPELLVRTIFLLFLGLSLMRFTFNRYYTLQSYAEEGLRYLRMERRAVDEFTIWGAIGVAIFAILAMLIGMLLLLPLYIYYYLVIFLRILFAPDVFFKIPFGGRRTVIAPIFLLVICLSCISILPPYWQAEHFNSYVKVTEEPPFKSEVPPSMVRLVDEGLAASTMSRYLSEFGSNAKLGDPHITVWNGELVWIAPVYPANLFAENYILGFIVVHANDPLRPPDLIKKRFYVGNVLLGGREVFLKSFLEDTSITASRAYFTFDDKGEIVLVLMRVEVTPYLYDVPGEILVFDSEGRIVGRYEPADAPDWIPQICDEDLIESIVSNIGQYYRNGTIDFFARGFLTIPASMDRLEMSEDTRYIINPDTMRVEAFIHVHPLGNDRTLAGIFRISKEGIVFHDFRRLGLISGRVAHDYAESLFPKPAVGEYFATMGMLYPVKHPITNETVWTWYVPIYWRKEATILLKGLVLINAHNISYFYWAEIEENEHGSDFVARVVEGYKRVLARAVGVGYQNRIEGDFEVLNVTSYISDGETHVVLYVKNVSGTETYFVEATAQDLNVTQWYELLLTKPGDKVHLVAIKVEDRWAIVEFNNTNIEI